jgi:carboxylesterase
VASASGARFDGSLVGDGKPLPIEIDGSEPSVLAFHGFGGTPLEIELVVQAARELGLRAHAPLLPGHGTHARELAATGWQHWSNAAERALDRFSGGPPVIVAGLSLGSLLAAHLAATQPERVRALVMLANAAWLTAPFPAWALSTLGLLRIPDFSIPKLGADIADPEARRTHLSYSLQPIHAAIEVQRAGARVRAELGRVRCPTLIVHGARDRVCPSSNARRVADLIGASDKRVLLLPRSRHIVTRDLERALLRKELLSFLGRFSSAAQRPVDP